MGLLQSMRSIFTRAEVPMIPKGAENMQREDPFFSVSLDQGEPDMTDMTERSTVVAYANSAEAADGVSPDVTEASASEIDAMETIVVGSDVEFDEAGHATVMRDGVAYDVYDMSARMGMKSIEIPTEGPAGANADEVTAEAAKPETTVDETTTDDAAADAEDGAEGADADGDEGIALRTGEEIVPLGFRCAVTAEAATEPMLAKWFLRAINETDMPNYADEPIIELYDGETGEFVSSYWVSQICDESEENAGMGLACKGGADKRYRIAYDDLVRIKELIKADGVIAQWLADHEGDMPDHNI